MPYPWRSRRDSVRSINMSSEPGNESFFCALRPILRILSLPPRDSTEYQGGKMPAATLANSSAHRLGVARIGVNVCHRVKSGSAVRGTPRSRSTPYCSGISLGTVIIPETVVRILDGGLAGQIPNDSALYKTGQPI